MAARCRLLLKVFSILLLKHNLLTSAASLSNHDVPKNLNNTTTEKVFYVYPETSSPVSIVYPSVDISNLNYTENTFSQKNQSAIDNLHDITLSDDSNVLTDFMKNENSSSVDLVVKNEYATTESFNADKNNTNENKTNIIEDNMKTNVSTSEYFTKDHVEMKTNTNDTKKDENVPIMMQIITVDGMEDYTPLNHSHMKMDLIINEEKIDKALMIENLNAPMSVMIDPIPQQDNKTKINVDFIPFTTDDVVMEFSPQKLQQNSSSAPNKKIDEIELDTDASDIVYDIEEIDKLLPLKEQKVFFKSTDIHPDNPYFRNIDEDSEKNLYIQLQDTNIHPLKEVIELPPESYASVWSGKVVEVKQDEPGDLDFHRHDNLLIVGLIPKPLVQDSFKNQLVLPTADNSSSFI